MVTQAQVNAGRILINVKHIELSKLHRKLQRVSKLVDIVTRDVEMPYTDENMETLMTHSLAAMLMGNIPMVLFWWDCAAKVEADLRSAMRLEYIHSHQARRLKRITERLATRVHEIDHEIRAIANRIGGM